MHLDCVYGPISYLGTSMFLCQQSTVSHNNQSPDYVGVARPLCRQLQVGRLKGMKPVVVR